MDGQLLAMITSGNIHLYLCDVPQRYPSCEVHVTSISTHVLSPGLSPVWENCGVIRVMIYQHQYITNSGALKCLLLCYDYVMIIYFIMALRNFSVKV